MRQPVQTVLSGPAAGVIGAVSVARAAGFADVISIDVGGTSADICLVRDGRPEITKDGMIGPFPLKLPILDIHTIGAGGGSIASVSAAGRLTVGPRSAGAEPGPVCYGRGGLEPTVTDAHLVLGRIPPALLGGELPLDVAAARAAIGERVGRPLGLSVEEAAAGIVEIVDNAMARAIRTVSVGRGHDPRRFALIAVRRRGSAARLPSRRAARHPVRDRAAAARACSRRGGSSTRTSARRSCAPSASPRAGPPPPSPRRSSASGPSWRRRPRRGSAPSRCRPIGAASSGAPTCATSTRASS